MATMKYRIKAIWAAIRGKEIEFTLNQIEEWLNGADNQKITDAVYSSNLEIDLGTKIRSEFYGND